MGCGPLIPKEESLGAAYTSCVLTWPCVWYPRQFNNQQGDNYDEALKKMAHKEEILKAQKVGGRWWW
jgi:hypothetical protein